MLLWIIVYMLWLLVYLYGKEIVKNGKMSNMQ